VYPHLEIHRLKSSEQIARLVKTGTAKKKFPIKLFFQENAVSELRIAVVASKRIFKKAVDRNKVKRLLREAFRLEIRAFTGSTNSFQVNLDLLFIYIGKEMPSLESLRKSIASLLLSISTKSKLN